MTLRSVTAVAPEVTGDPSRLLSVSIAIGGTCKRGTSVPYEVTAEIRTLSE